MQATKQALLQCIHKHPQAFTQGYQNVSRYMRYENLNFNRFKYKLFGVSYTTDSSKFRNAFKKYKMWIALKQQTN